MSGQCELSSVSVLYGNKVSHSERKTRRRFEPNIRVAHLLSDVTEQKYRFKLAARTLRTVEKMGGLDQYLIKVSDKLLSQKAKSIKKVILKQMEAKNEA